MVRLLIIFFSLVLIHSKISANSCCGQSPASFSVLSLSQSSSLGLGFSYLQTQGRVLGNNNFYIWDNKKRSVQSMNLNISGTLFSRQQYFVSAGFLTGEYEDSVGIQKSSHITDVQMGYTYEALPEYSYSNWKPLLYLSLLSQLPTGRSIYDEKSLTEGAGVTGHNQLGLGLGLTMRKVFFPLIITFQAKSIYLFEKKFQDILVSDFFDSSVALLSTYAFKFQKLTLDLGLTYSHLTERRLKNFDVASLESQNFNFLIGLQRPISENMGIGLNYADQTLFGPAKNSILNRAFTLNIYYNNF